ncbi:hypothetical protein AGMMS49942_11640 [Spirochaetia bacterium]|nr:hypothetical protein AGMMS49942_11640 [Spirochaetia bacterium]
MEEKELGYQTPMPRSTIGATLPRWTTPPAEPVLNIGKVVDISVAFKNGSGEAGMVPP